MRAPRRACTTTQEIEAIRNASAVLVLALAGAAHAAFVETHKNEITQPVADYVTARVAALEALPAPTKAEKKELGALRKLAKTLAKTQLSLAGDFKELSAAAKAKDALKTAGAPMQSVIDQAIARAQISLSERIELGDDYAAAFLDSRRAQQVRDLLEKVGAQRAKAGTSTTDAKRAAALAKTDALLTSTLKKADKYLLVDRGAEFVPPTRFRSGDAVGFGGGRVAIPRDSGSPVAGASVLIPIGALANPTVITIAPAAGFVGGRDTPAGPAIAVTPDALTLGSAARVSLPFTLPAGADVQDLALFAAGPPVTALQPATTNPDGTLSASSTKLSTFQAGIAAPPPGRPSGAYHLMMILVATALETGGADAADSAEVRVGVIDQTITFRPDLTGSTASPFFQDVARNFRRDGVHHTDTAGNSAATSVDFTWTADGPGRFSFAFPMAGGAQAPASGVASDDGRVIAFAGRGDFEFLGVAVRGGGDVVVTDLDGRWAAAEFGVELRDDLAEPFTTRWHSALRWFTASNGNVTYEAQGVRAETDVTYRTDQADPVHVLAENTVADGGTATWAVLPSGRFSEAMNRRIGWFDRDAGVLVSRSYDPAARQIALLVAVRQPAAATPGALPGLSRFAQLEVGATAGAPTTRSSTHEPATSTGTLDVASATDATLSDDAATRRVCTLSGPIAAGIGIDWTMSAASTSVPAAQTPLTLSLDAAGNHLAPADARWFAFSGDGNYVLTVVRGSGARPTRGIALGMK